MESCCPTGESLRRSYELFHVIEPDQDQEFGPWPINTPSARFEKPEPPTLIILKTHKKITEERAAALAHENSIAAAA
ncbi:MAG: hypothetical protein CMM25_05680, partial [Rhodospirillaceae bacterium]|nr:hypothetical protein [Rhodospirillaceae bacterium]